MLLVFVGPLACGGSTANDPRGRGAFDGGPPQDVTRGEEDSGAHGGGRAPSQASATGGAGPWGDAGTGGSSGSGDSSGSGGSSGNGTSTGGALSMGGADPSSGGSSVGGVEALGGTNSMGGAVATGGKAGAGGAGGTEASGGAAGTSSEVPRPEFLPDHCEVRSTGDVSDTSCSLSARCGGSFVATNCQQAEGGSWQCSCGSIAAVALEIDGAAGIEACAVAVDLCAAPEPDKNAASCVDTTQSSSPNSCSLTRSCVQEIHSPLPQGVEARFLWQLTAGCGPFGQVFECYADGVDNAFPFYKVIANDVQDACGPYLDFVSSGRVPVLGNTVECAGLEPEPAASGCSVVRRCGRVMELADGVQFGDLEVNYGACNEEADGSTGCYCQYGQTQLLFTTDEAPSNELCAEIVVGCVEGADVQAQGDLECAVSSLVDFETSCDVYATCEQEVVVNDRAATAEAYVTGSCQWAYETGSWWCSCEEAAYEFELVESLSGWDACSLLPEACANRAPVFAGSLVPQSNE